MINNNQINTRQFTFLVILFVIGDSILFVPASVTAFANQDGWLSALFATVIAILIVTMYGFLGKRFPSMNIVGIGEKVFSLWIGKIVGILFVFFFLIDSSLLLWEMGDFMTTQVMPQTPINAILILFLSIVIIGIKIGVEPFTRTAEIIFPWVVLLFLILFLAVSPNINPENIQPMLENGIKPVLLGALPLIGYHFETVILLMVLPHINQVKRIVKSYIVGMIIGNTFLFMTILLCILVLGSQLTSSYIYPSYALARKINIGNFLQRLEAILAFIWFFTVYFKLTITFYATLVGLTQILKIKDYKVLTFPLALILYAFVLIIGPNTTYVSEFLRSSWWPFSLIYGLFLPLLLIIVAKLRKKY